MSIYGTMWCSYPDDHDDHCAKWRRCTKAEAEASGLYAWGDDGYSLLDDSRDCTCDAGTLPYFGSHVLPAETDTPRGSIEVACIPGHITRDGRDAEKPADDDDHWPYMRLCVNDAETVLNHRHVTELHDALGTWLDRAGPLVAARSGVGEAD